VSFIGSPRRAPTTRVSHLMLEFEVWIPTYHALPSMLLALNDQVT
jgi:hypothetical protein